MKDKQLQNLIRREIERQNETIDLIASENYASSDILGVVGSPLMNKYSEGYPGKRYYPGNAIYDEIELLAKKRALLAFGLEEDEWSVNVQPYSGSPANIAIYAALMDKNDVLMGMNLPSGGHLTHGHKVSFSGRFFNAIQYGVNAQTGLIDFNEVRALAKKHKPKVIVSGFTAYPRQIDFKKFGEIAKEVGAYHVADISHIAGLVLAGLHPSPFANADVVMTTTHKTLRGPRGAVIFARKYNPNDTNQHPNATNFIKNRSNNSDKLSRHSDYMSIAERIDKSVFPGLQGGPHNNITAAKALAFFEASQSGFKKYQKQIVTNARTLAVALMKLGFKLLTDGTDNHLLLVDLKNNQLDGITAEKMLEQNGIVANRNSILGDISPFKPSGLRLGTPAVTTRGMKESQMKKIAELIYRCLIDKKNVNREVAALCKKFPLLYKS